MVEQTVPIRLYTKIFKPVGVVFKPVSVAGYRVVHWLRNGLAIMGFAVLAVLGVFHWKPALKTVFFFLPPVQAFFADQVEEVTVNGRIQGGADWLGPPVTLFQAGHGFSDPHTMQPLTFLANMPLTQEQERIALYLSNRYHIAIDAAQALTRSAYGMAKDYELDPMLILAVAGIESSFNPLAASNMGAKGLMQIMTNLHSEKFDVLVPSQRSAFHPMGNMLVGAQVLRDCIRRGGSLEAGLRMYVGAGISGNDGGYPDKVKAERQRIWLAAGGPTTLQAATGLQTLDRHTLHMSSGSAQTAASWAKNPDNKQSPAFTTSNKPFADAGFQNMLAWANTGMVLRVSDRLSMLPAVKTAIPANKALIAKHKSGVLTTKTRPPSGKPLVLIAKSARSGIKMVSTHNRSGADAHTRQEHTGKKRKSLSRMAVVAANP